VPLFVGGADLHYAVDPFYGGVGVVVKVGCHVDLFVAEVGHDGGVASCFHLVFVPDYGETAPFFGDRGLHADELVDDLFFTCQELWESGGERE